MVLGNNQTILRLHMPNATDTAIQAGELSPWHVALKSALTLASNSVKEITALIGLIAALTAAFYFYRDSLKLPGYWPELIIVTTIVLFIALFFLPSLRAEIRKYKLAQLGVHGVLVTPSYFRLVAYEKKEADQFTRPDDASDALCQWIDTTTKPLLYLTGQSGVGKSSLINAKLLPALAGKSWITLALRPHDTPLAQMRTALLAPGAVWAKQPVKGAPTDLHALLIQAAEKTLRDDKRLLLVIDQFEEALILCTPEAKAELAALLKQLVVRPVPGLTLVLSLRADYLNDLPALGLPYPHYGPDENSFEVRPFSRAAGQRFLEASGLRLGDDLLNHIMEEAAQIEDMPDRVRPVVLNMFGLVVSKFSGALPKNIRAGRLMTGYIERAIKETRSPELALGVLRALTTDAGTKQCLTIEQVAQQADAEPFAVRGCMLLLSKQGILRCLPGDPERWEVAHDFMARLIQPLLSRWPGLSKRTQHRLNLLAMGLWIGTVGAGVNAYPWLMNLHTLNKLKEIGIVAGAPRGGKVTFEYNGTPITDVTAFWEGLSAVSKLTEPAKELIITNTRTSGINPTNLVGFPYISSIKSLSIDFQDWSSFYGLPELPNLKSIEVGGIFCNDRVLDFNTLPILPQVEHIAIKSNIISNLRGLERLKTLKALTIGGCIKYSSLDDEKISPVDFSIIGQIKSLNTIDINIPGAAIDADELARSENITDISLQGVKIINQDGLSKLAKIKNLKLVNVKLNYAEKLPMILNLRSLALYPNIENAIDNMASIPPFPNLKKLSVGGYNKGDFIGMPTLPNLEHLELNVGGLSFFGNLHDLPPLPRLTRLDIRGTKIKDLTGLKPAQQKIKVVVEKGRTVGLGDVSPEAVEFVTE